jgi:hypothetical protein
MRHPVHVRPAVAAFLAVSLAGVATGCGTGGGSSSAIPMPAFRSRQIIPWTSGHGSSDLGKIVIGDTIGYDIECIGPGKVTMRFAPTSLVASARCPGASGESGTDGGFLVGTPRNVDVRVSAAKTDRWLVEVDRVCRSYSLPVGPLNAWIQRNSEPARVRKR